jgi:hypothetical protein
MTAGRFLGASSLAMLLCVANVGGRDQDATALLAAARQALGGDAALSAITSFSVTGSLTRMVVNHVTSSIDIKCVLPDRFLRVSNQTMDAPGTSFSITRYEGFNRDEPLVETVAPGAPFPVVMRSGPEPRTPDEIAAAKLRQANTQKRLFVGLTLPLFAASFAGHPLTFTAGGQVQIDKRPVDVVIAKGPDDFEWRLFLDAATHLPVRLSWLAKPIVMMSTSSTMAVNSRTGAVVSGGPPPPPLPPGDPTASLPDVRWDMTIDDYRVADGLNWPHRFTTSFTGDRGGRHQEVRLGRFRLNPSIDAKVFAPRK